MSNDMKLIMEAWRESLKEDSQDQAAHDKASRHLARTVAGEKSRTGASGKVYPGTDSGRRDVEALRDLELNPDDFTIKKLLDSWESFEEEHFFMALLIDLIDPIGITDWRDAVRSWNAYMDWYMQDDEKKALTAVEGAGLFIGAVFNIVTAFPFVDLIPGVMAAKRAKGAAAPLHGFIYPSVLKYIAKKLTQYTIAAGGVAATHYALTKDTELSDYATLLNKAKEDLEAKQELIDKYDNKRPDSNAVKRSKERIKSREALAKIAKIADPSVLQQPGGGARTQN